MVGEARSSVVDVAEARGWVAQSGERLLLSEQGRDEVLAFSASF